MFNACFIKSATKPGGYPEYRDSEGSLLPEVAVAGRSNVGKSSLLNHLFRRRKLAKISTTPGKTRCLNFFVVDDRMLFADLPGYGWAKVSKEIRKQWGPMVQTYLQERTSLQLILLLLDIRRLPNDDDKRLVEWIIAYEKAMILVLTKTDKVSSNVQSANTKKILQSLGLENVHYVHYSTKKDLGRSQLIAMINDALADETAAIQG